MRRRDQPAGCRQCLVPRIIDTDGVRAYGGQMSEIPNGGPPAPDDEEHTKDLPADVFSPVVDPESEPDAAAATPEGKSAREHPEETGS
jgi:hypothetical protein